MPLLSGDRTMGAVALAVDASDGNAVNHLVREPDQGQRRHRREPGLAATGVDRHATMPAWCCNCRTAFCATPTLAEGAIALVNELAAALGCDRVTLGLVDGRELEVIAVSNSAEFKSEQELLRQIAAAMQEAVDQGNRVVYPVAPAPSRSASCWPMPTCTNAAAMRWPASRWSMAARRSVRCWREWRGAAAAEQTRLDLLDSLACALGPLLALRQRAERGWSTRVGERLGTRLADA